MNSGKLGRGVLLASVASIGGVLLYFVYNLDASGESLLPACFFHKVTGLHCPGCGGTRAVHALLHGDFAAAFAWNPLALAILPFLGMALLNEVWLLIAGKKLFSIYAARDEGFVLIAVVLIFWVMRNLPWFPYTELAPHAIAGVSALP